MAPLEPASNQYAIEPHTFPSCKTSCGAPPPSGCPTSSHVPEPYKTIPLHPAANVFIGSLRRYGGCHVPGRNPDRKNRLREPPTVSILLQAVDGNIRIAPFPTELPGGTDALLSVDNVADILHLSPAYVREAGADLLPIVRVGRRVRYRLSDLLSLIERSTQHREPDLSEEKPGDAVFSGLRRPSIAV